MKDEIKFLHEVAAVGEQEVENMHQFSVSLKEHSREFSDSCQTIASLKDTKQGLLSEFKEVFAEHSSEFKDFDNTAFINFDSSKLKLLSSLIKEKKEAVDAKEKNLLKQIQEIESSGSFDAIGVHYINLKKQHLSLLEKQEQCSQKEEKLKELEQTDKKLKETVHYAIAMFHDEFQQDLYRINSIMHDGKLVRFNLDNFLSMTKGVQQFWDKQVQETELIYSNKEDQETLKLLFGMQKYLEKPVEEVDAKKFKYIESKLEHFKATASFLKNETVTDTLTNINNLLEGKKYALRYKSLIQDMNKYVSKQKKGSEIYSTMFTYNNEFKNFITNIEAAKSEQEIKKLADGFASMTLTAFQKVNGLYGSARPKKSFGFFKTKKSADEQTKEAAVLNEIYTRSSEIVTGTSLKKISEKTVYRPK